MEEMLRMEGISKRFGTFYANHGVNLDISAARSTRSSERTERASRPS